MRNADLYLKLNIKSGRPLSEKNALLREVALQRRAELRYVATWKNTSFMNEQAMQASFAPETLGRGGRRCE